MRETAAVVMRRSSDQGPRRWVEQRIRTQAVALCETYNRCGFDLWRAGLWMGVTESTLREWQQRVKRETGPCPLGRPKEPVDRDTHDAVVNLLWLVGPDNSVAFVREMFPDVPRAYLEDLTRRTRNAVVRADRQCRTSLQWQKPGLVWSMDWFEPPLPIDGEFPIVLVVRDLASGRQLLVLPTYDKTDKTVEWALKTLFRWYGPPLVLKADNGFHGDLIKKLLRDFGATPLYSPEYYPKYNGAVEVGIGQLQTRAAYHAARCARPGEWTCDDLWAAQGQANELARPRGICGPSPDALWRERDLLDPSQRKTFLDNVQHWREKLTRERKVAENVADANKNKRQEKQLERVAITRALIEAGCLLIQTPSQKPSVSLPFFASNYADIP